MEQKDFKPRIGYEPSPCFPCFRCLDKPVVKQDAYEVRQTMKLWLETQHDKIVVVRIEALDFNEGNLFVQKGHLRVHYQKRI